MAAKKKKRTAPKAKKKAARTATRKPKKTAKKKKAKRAAPQRIASPKVRLRRARKIVQPMDKVDESSLESFPASDPPSWTPVTGEDR